MQSSPQAICIARTSFQGCRQGSGMGWEAAAQFLPQLGVLPAQGIKPIGCGRRLGEAPHQLLPALLSYCLIAKGFGGQGIAFEHQGGQLIATPALATQQTPLAYQVACCLAPQQQQAGLPAAFRIGREPP
jgi:hypothetical protein